MSSSTTWRARLIGQSDLFDRAWYLKTYPDVARAGGDPVQHWIMNGAHEGYDPGPRFRTDWYIETYPDVAMTGENPLVHHLVIGRELRRKTSPGGGGSSWWQPLRASEDGAADVPTAETTANPEPTAIIIPVYNAPEELGACIASVLRNTWGRFRLILIDDASPDPKVADILRARVGTPGVEMHRNPENLGFTRTINRGIELAGRADVVFLNSDTEVPPNWLRNLRLAAYSRARVGSVSPFSNNAGAFSAPVMGESNPLPDWLDLDALGRVAAQGSLRLHPEVPTSHGFCMYVRRDCLDEMGRLDAEAFSRGYGEENDFCMRSGRAGWVHLLDDATLVYHVRSASFGDAKTGLLKAGRELIDARYPEYKSAISAFSKDAAIRRTRQRLDEAISASCSDPAGVLPRVLYVVSTRTGGTPQTNQDLMSALSGDVETLLLRCDSETITLQLFRENEYEDLETHRLSEKIEAFPHRSAEYDSVVRGWLIRYAIELVHIRHIAWHGLGLVETAKTLGLPVVFSFHDFYTVCPTVKLLDDELRFCGGRCTISAGECQHELWPVTDFPRLKNAAIHDWQAGFAAMLRLCDAFVTTTDSTRETMTGIYPFLAERPFEVIPHGRDLQDAENLAAPRVEGEPLRLLVPGNISIAKGGDLLRRMAEAAPKGSLEIHVLGPIANATGLRRHAIPHGSYRREEFHAKVARIRPHMGAVFSIWPETYCHTLTEMWSCGLPVAGLDHGAVGDRIRASGAGWALPREDPAALLARLLKVARDPDEMAEKTAAVRTWQETEGVANTTRAMAGRYFRLYSRLAAPKSPADDFARIFEEAGAPLGDETVAVACPGGRLTDGYASTHVRVWERTRNRLGAPHYYQRVTPREIVPMARLGLISKAIIQRNAIPAALEAEMASLVEAGKLVTVLDIDDNLMEVPAEKDPKGAYRAYAPFLKRQLAQAARVSVSVPELADALDGITDRVSVLRNQLSRPVWGPPPDRAPGSDRRITVLYMGTRTHDADLDLVRSAFADVARRHPAALLKIIGGLEKPWTQSPGWLLHVPVPDGAKAYPQFVTWLRAEARTAVFAIAPLVRTDFNRYKSGLKFLDYAGLGLSGLFSDVEQYRAHHQDSGCGRLVGDADWAAALDDAIQDYEKDPHIWERQGMKARTWAVEKHMLPPILAGDAT